MDWNYVCRQPCAHRGRHGRTLLPGGGAGGRGPRRWPGRPIVFVGAQRGIEARLLPQSPGPICCWTWRDSPAVPRWRAARSAWKLLLAWRRLTPPGGATAPGRWWAPGATAPLRPCWRPGPWASPISCTNPTPSRACWSAPGPRGGRGLVRHGGGGARLPRARCVPPEPRCAEAFLRAFHAPGPWDRPGACWCSGGAAAPGP